MMPPMEQALALPLPGEPQLSRRGGAQSGSQGSHIHGSATASDGVHEMPASASSRKNVVFGVGSLEAELMFIGEAPGADEDIQGEPFVARRASY